MSSRLAQNIEYFNLLNSFSDEHDVVVCQKLTIPEFQRNYVWKSVNIKDIFESIRDNDANYYLGNIVVVKETVGRSKIVDGQQRLVSLSLMAKKLIDKTNDVEKKLALKKLIWADAGGDHPVLRIEFKKSNLKTLYENIINDTAYNDTELDGSQKILHTAFNAIGRECDGIANVDSFVDKFLSVEFVVIVSPSDEDAYQLFEGLNSTGLSLSAVELTKNAILGKVKILDHTRIDEAVGIWSSIERNFETTNIAWFSKFLRHQWFSEKGYVSNSNLFREIKNEKINKNNLTLDDIFDYLGELEADSRIYISFRTANLNKNDFGLTIHEDAWINIVKYVCYIEKLGVDQAYSVLLALYKYGRRGNEYFKRGDSFQRHIENMWRFLLIVKYTKVSPSSFEKEFSEICNKIQASNYTDFKIKMSAFFVELSVKIAGLEDDFSTTLGDSTDYSIDDRGMIRCILEDYLVTEGEGSDSEIEAEHIVPEGNLEKWTAVVDKETLASHVGLLGNLTLLRNTLNQDAGHKCFDEKYAVAYLKSKFTVNNKLNVEWGGAFNSNDPLNNAIVPRGIKIGRVIYSKYFSSLNKL